jgi:3-hydroxyisobutyrate dehydrogenase-like beta-hydroxyacid dehydrogenase
MAARLIERGIDVTVWNRNPARCEGFPQVAATQTQAAAGADVVVLMLADAAAVDEVTRPLPEQLTVVDMSTSGPECARMLGHRFRHACDAPVGGSLSEAEQGTLAVYAGGEDELVTSLEPLLSLLGAVHRMGPLGSGQSIKLAGNMLMLANTAALAEALDLVRRLGLDPERALAALAAGPGSSRAVTHKGPAMLRREYGPPARFTLRLAAKDALLARELSGGPVSAMVARLYQQALDQGLGDRDYSAVWERR